MLGDITLGLHHSLHAAGHRVGEDIEVLRPPAKNLPGASDLLGQVITVCGGPHTCNDQIELPPQVLNRVKVTALTHPIKNRDLSVICEPGLGRRTEYLYALTYSMPGRVEAVVEAEGDVTKY